MSIREPLKKDAMEMAQVLYAGLRPLRMFPVLWPGAQRDNWIEVQADYCVQHLEENHSVAFVTVDEKATTTGIAYARFLDATTVPASSAVTFVGGDDKELDKLDNGPLQKTLIGKYGGILCE